MVQNCLFQSHRRDWFLFIIPGWIIMKRLEINSAHSYNLIWVVSSRKKKNSITTRDSNLKPNADCKCKIWVEKWYITNVILCASVGGTFPGPLKNYFGHVVVWSSALAGESPCVLSLHFWLINVPGEVSVVVRKPTTIARVPSVHDTFFQRINYDWCPCFSGEPGNCPWGSRSWHSGLGNSFWGNEFA